MQSTDLTLTLPEWMQLPVPEYADPDAVRREEVISWDIYPDAGVVGFLSIVLGDIDTARQSAEDIDPVESVSLTPIDEDSYYAYVEMSLREADATLMATFADRRLVVVPPVVYTDRETVHVTVLGADEALSGLLDRVPDDVGVTVERVSDHRRRPGTLASRLTDRQYEATRVARAVGYFEVPREGTLATVADRLGCSESAASKLLRNAQAELVDGALGDRPEST